MDKFFRTVKKIHRESVKVSNRAERERKRQDRVNAAYFNALQKEEDIRDVAREVEHWNQHLKTIQSLHMTCSSPLCWKEIEAQDEPQQVSLGEYHTQLARRALESYKPTFIHKLFNQVHKKKVMLEANIQQAEEQDLKDFEEAQIAYKTAYKAWGKLNDIAVRIRKKEPQSYLDAIDHFKFLSSLNGLGTRFELNIFENFIDIDLHVNGDDIIPKYVLSQTKTGKLSRKNMTKTMYYDLYQDHICSAILRVAREIFAHLPIDKVRINAFSKIVNSQNGHLEDSIILSVIIPRETLKTLNLRSIDPSDSMQNFIHTMNFRKTQGFKVVEKVEFEI